MSTYIAQSRSNYFKVKDEELFRKFCGQYELEILAPDAKSADRRFGFLFYGSLPMDRTDDNDNWIEADLVQELSQQLAPGEVAVVIQVGWEKMAVLTGYARAVNDKGETVEVNLTDIYRLAEQRFGVVPTETEG